MPKRLITKVLDLDRAFLILTAVALFSYIILFLGYYDQRNETKRLAQDALLLAENNKKLSMEIQEQRRQSIRLQCEDQNKRHVDIENFLIDQGQTQEDNPALFVFIDKLAPLRDCDQVVAELTQ